ncbi:MAG: metallophosphoesterase family protein [Acetatifactor sp.]|nr:metallophosphoesterase family protein [Acetatifactor sp.]
MKRKFYISDLHIGHNNIITYDSRPFGSMEEMNGIIIQNWNAAVGKDDEVYVLGDFFWNNKDGDEILPQLHGDIYLIKGNHDELTDSMRKRYIWVQDYAEIKDGETSLVLCHYPIAHWKNSKRGTVHLYGHIHMGRDSRPFGEYVKLMQQKGLRYECHNVGCMLPYINYTPRTLEEIQKGDCCPENL